MDAETVLDVPSDEPANPVELPPGLYKINSRTTRLTDQRFLRSGDVFIKVDKKPPKG